MTKYLYTPSMTPKVIVKDTNIHIPQKGKLHMYAFNWENDNFKYVP